MLISIGSVLKDDMGNSFTLDKMINSGGFGSVYQARRDNDDKIFAVKTLSSAFESEDKLRSFQNEIRLTAKIASPYVIKYEFAHDGTKYPEFPPYIIMEFAQGTLSEIICEQTKLGDPFENEALVQMFNQLASGMKTINNVLVHRDIKPDNILVCDNILKISDFGLSKIAGEDTRTLSFKGYGTLKYIAPEAWNNDTNTIQMDIYSMGIVFYELATLQYPYELKESYDQFDIRDVHLYHTPKNSMKANPELAPHLASLIMKMTEKSTQKRYTNWDDIISALSLEITTTDFISTIVGQATRRRTEADLKYQNVVLEEQKHKQEIEDYCKLIYSQYERTILTPIKDFAEQFNMSYQGDQKIVFAIPSPYRGGYKFLNRGC